MQQELGEARQQRGQVGGAGPACRPLPELDALLVPCTCWGHRVALRGTWCRQRLAAVWGCWTSYPPPPALVAPAQVPGLVAALEQAQSQLKQLHQQQAVEMLDEGPPSPVAGGRAGGRAPGTAVQEVLQPASKSWACAWCRGRAAIQAAY
jgi:hypothetical protein